MKAKVANEIDILSACKHQNIVQLLETFKSGDAMCLVMELCPGGNLLSYLRKRRKLPELHAKYIFKQLIQALAHLHDNLIVHRDIKLENILLDGHGQVKIVDFGVSTRINYPDQLLKRRCGTSVFMAPEIPKNEEYEGPPVDVWSAAICLFALIYG